nr:hypothetical protein [uncultured Mediterranean phage uvMED]
MASIKLKHATGNSTIVHSPAANPSSDVTLKLPSTTGSAGQVLKVASANHSPTNAELEFAADAGGKIVGQYYATSTAEFQSTSGSFQNAHTITFTPASATSKFLIIFMPARVIAQSGLDGEIRFSDGTSASHQYRIANGGSTYKTPSIVFWHNHVRPNSPMTFTCQTRDISGGNNGFMVGDSGSPTVIIVLEIEQ